MFIRKMISAITPIFVWLVINVYVLIFSKFLSPLSGLIVDKLPSSLPWVLAITLLINAFAQVAIVSLTTIVAIRVVISITIPYCRVMKIDAFHEGIAGV